MIDITNPRLLPLAQALLSPVEPLTRASPCLGTISCLYDNDTGSFTPQAETEEKSVGILHNRPWNGHGRCKDQRAKACFPFSRFVLAGQEGNVAMGNAAIDIDGCRPVQVVCRFMGILRSVSGFPVPLSSINVVDRMSVTPNVRRLRGTKTLDGTYQPFAYVTVVFS